MIWTVLCTIEKLKQLQQVLWVFGCLMIESSSKETTSKQAHEEASKQASKHTPTTRQQSP